MQKTAYDMLISDWSSDVCFSDLSLVVSTSPLGGATLSVVVPTSTSAVSTSKAGICPPSVFTSGRAVSLVWSISTSPNANTAMTTSTATTAMIKPVRAPPDIICPPFCSVRVTTRSEEHTSELQSLMRISYAVFCLKQNSNPYNEPLYKHTKTQQHK